MSDRQLYDIAGCVKYFHDGGADAATPNFVRGLITSGQLPRERIGRKFYVLKADLDAWILRNARRARA